MSALVRKRLTFSGDVQGVGFRWRTRHAARAVGATGWVRNERDGRVSMELQGTEEQIDQVLDALERGLYIRISDIEVRSLPAEPEERSFVTRDDGW